jgi:hypothetical protein
MNRKYYYIYICYHFLEDFCLSLVFALTLFVALVV